jgi:hypothetical protein
MARVGHVSMSTGHSKKEVPTVVALVIVALLLSLSWAIS